MYRHLQDVGRRRDVRKVGAGSAGRVAELDEAADEAVEAERDVRGGEAEHGHGDPEDHGRKFACAAEA